MKSTMKKINFKEIQIETEVDVFQTYDLRKEVGNLLFKQATNLAMDELSRRIFKSEGEITIEDDDFTELLEALKTVIVYRALRAIENAAKDIEKSKKAKA